MKVLIAVSQHGFWVEELLKPLDRLDEAGIAYELVVPYKAKTPFPDKASLDATYVDPPLGRTVTTMDIATRGQSMDWERLFYNCHTLEGWFPIRPYMSAEKYLYALEAYYERRKDAWKKIEVFDALLLVGGGGPVVDMVNNPRLHDLILGFYYAGKPIAAECYTVTCLAFARELDTRESILRGKHVTGHTMEYDYTSGWATDNGTLVFNSPPYPLEYVLRDTVGPDGRFHGNVGCSTSVIVDYPFITSRSVESSDRCGVILVKVLKEGLRRDGW
jgi:putative intracellular protease/amidase